MSGHPAFTSPLAESLERFLQLKRAMGFKYVSEELILHDLDRFLAQRLPKEDPVITLDVTRDFIARRGTETDSTRVHWLTVLREFCRFRTAEDPRTVVPPRSFLPIRRSLFVPRILDLAEGRRFLKACMALPPGRCSPLRGTVLGTALVLLYLGGLRTGEVLRLSVEDVDLASAILRIRDTKFGKSRLVPIATDLNELMKRCRFAVDRQYGPRPIHAPFFPSPRGGPYSRSALHASFCDALAIAKIGGKAGDKRPRLHDLRHSFAVNRVILWYRQNADLGAMLPGLAVYLGHVDLVSTQRYLRVTEDVLAEIIRRHQQRFGHLIREKPDA